MQTNGRRAVVASMQDEVLDGDGVAILDQATVAQLRAMLTPTQRAELLDTFVLQHEHCIESLADALHRSDQPAIARLAHILKGSSAGLGATRLSLACEQIECGRMMDPDVGETQVARLRAIAGVTSDALRRVLT